VTKVIGMASVTRQATLVCRTFQLQADEAPNLTPPQAAR
jgi:hypothetical protein